MTRKWLGDEELRGTVIEWGGRTFTVPNATGMCKVCEMDEADLCAECAEENKPQTNLRTALNEHLVMSETLKSAQKASTRDLDAARRLRRMVKKRDRWIRSLIAKARKAVPEEMFK